MAVERIDLRTPGESAAPPDLDAPELYLSRELTYLSFCQRVPSGHG